MVFKYFLFKFNFQTNMERKNERKNEWMDICQKKER